MWTSSNLHELIMNRTNDYLFFVVSNRQPYIHTYNRGKITHQRGPGGVITAIEPIMQACNGTWIAYGNGTADRKVSDSQGKIKIQLENSSYTLKHVWLNKEEENGYYYVRLGDSGLLLRMSAMRAGKLCSFQCKFHRDLLDRIAEFESRVKA